MGGSRRAEARQGDAGKDEARQRQQLVVAEEACYQRGAGIEQGEERGTHHQAEPEDGVVVGPGRLALIDDGVDEARLDEYPRHGGEDGQHAHHAIVGRREQPRQEDAEDEARHLHPAVAYHAPDESACRLGLEIVAHRVVMMLVWQS